jgi:amidase
MTELWRLSACEAVARLKRRELSPGELIEAALARIEAVGRPVNALPTMCAERARAAAARLETADADDPGWLAGLPLAIKDTADVAGVRTTYGSPIYADHVPTRSSATVAMLEARGALVLAKSNTPEFAAGANTFNEVFGKTRNPWRTTQTAGGSSGGAAAALATGQVWLAHGSDLGGSLRIPGRAPTSATPPRSSACCARRRSRRATPRCSRPTARTSSPRSSATSRPASR